MKKQMIQTIKNYQNQTLDTEFQSSKLFKPIIKAHEEKQDKLIEQLDKNQKALASNLEDIVMLQYMYENQKKQANCQLIINQKRKF